SKDEFDEANLYFTSSIEMYIFNSILNSYRNLHTKKSNSLIESEAKTDLTNSEEKLYLLTKGQSFANWKDAK
ncbi:10208_t:CDS:1, partial [Gigaspora margarita]